VCCQQNVGKNEKQVRMCKQALFRVVLRALDVDSKSFAALVAPNCTNKTPGWNNLTLLFFTLECLDDFTTWLRLVLTGLRFYENQRHENIER